MNRSRRGFTAIEVTMVATVIAILALIILPMFQKRVEKAKLAAAQDDMMSIVKQEMLVFADTDHCFRTQDLDNTRRYVEPPDLPDLEIPITFWDEDQGRYRLLSVDDRRRLRPEEKWQGPYMSFHNFVTIGDLYDSRPGIVDTGDESFPYGIRYFQGDDSEDDKVPVDPWGSPYLFFGPYPGATDTESLYYTSVVYSLGPDGGPGIGNPDSPALFTRWFLDEMIRLGEEYSDDFRREF